MDNVKKILALPQTKIATAILMVLIAILIKLMPKSLKEKILLKLGLVDKSIWPMDAWVNKRCEEAIDPDMEIIDAHHHLWDPRIQPKGWGIPQWQIQGFYQYTSPRDIVEMTKQDHIRRGKTAVLNSFGWRQLPFMQPYMGPEFRLDIRNRDRNKLGHNIVKTVYLECGWTDEDVIQELRPIGEAEMVESVSADYPTLCNGMVAYANLSHPEVEKTLQGLSEHKIVKGIRHALAWTSDKGIEGAGEDIKEDTASQPDFRKGFALLEKYGFSYDVWAFHEQLEQLTKLAKAFPNQVIILDHVGEPLGISTYTREKTWPKWKKGIEELAQASKNVNVKLSGLGMCRTGFRHDELDKPPTSEVLAKDWGPYFKVVIDAFGVERCMFASNFPVDKASTDYTIMWNAFKLIVKDYTKEEKRLLFYENAERIYRL